MFRNHFGKPRLVLLFTGAAIFLVLFLLGSWLTEASGAPLANIKSASCEDPGMMVILLDNTVEDKQALQKELIDLFSEIIEIFKANGESLFGYKIALAYLNEDGESAPEWTFQFPHRFGQRRTEWNDSLSLLTSNLKTTIDDLNSDHRHHHYSFLIEGTSQYLKKLGDCDRLEIISDLYVVDRSGNNFERLTFNQPQYMRSKAKVRIHRIGVKGRSQRSIQLVEAWWDEFVFGKNKFQKIAKMYSQKTSHLREMSSPPIKQYQMARKSNFKEETSSSPQRKYSRNGPKTVHAGGLAF